MDRQGAEIPPREWPRVPGRSSAFILLLLLAVRPAAGLSTEPWTLWSLTAEADVVVLARVLTVQPSPEVTARLGIDVPPVAVLRVEEVWKGVAPPIALVPFEPTLCPAGPVYAPGERVVAFLDHEPWYLPTFRTVGLAFGTRYASPYGVHSVREMVRRARRLHERGLATEAERRAWLVEAASRPGTQWDGLHGLAGWASSVRWDSPRPAGDLVQRAGLTERELARISEGFVRFPPMGPALPMALALFAGREDPQIDERAVFAVEELLVFDWGPGKPVPSWLLDAIALVLERYGDTDPAGRLGPLAADSEPVDVKALRAVWRGAKEELGIRAGAMAFTMLEDGQRTRPVALAARPVGRPSGQLAPRERRLAPSRTTGRARTGRTGR